MQKHYNLPGSNLKIEVIQINKMIPCIKLCQEAKGEPITCNCYECKPIKPTN